MVDVPFSALMVSYPPNASVVAETVQLSARTDDDAASAAPTSATFDAVDRARARAGQVRRLFTAAGSGRRTGQGAAAGHRSPGRRTRPCRCDRATTARRD